MQQQFTFWTRKCALLRQQPRQPQPKRRQHLIRPPPPPPPPPPSPHPQALQSPGSCRQRRMGCGRQVATICVRTKSSTATRVMQNATTTIAVTTMERAAGTWQHRRRTQERWAWSKSRPKRSLLLKGFAPGTTSRCSCPTMVPILVSLETSAKTVARANTERATKLQRVSDPGPDVIAVLVGLAHHARPT